RCAGHRAAGARPAAQVVAVADLAALVVDHAVAALQLAVCVAAVAIDGVAVVALLVAVEDTIAHALDGAAGRAAVAVLGVAVVAWPPPIELAVTTARLRRGPFRGARSGREGAASAAGEEGATG